MSQFEEEAAREKEIFALRQKRPGNVVEFNGDVIRFIDPTGIDLKDENHAHVRTVIEDLNPDNNFDTSKTNLFTHTFEDDQQSNFIDISPLNTVIEYVADFDSLPDPAQAAPDSTYSTIDTEQYWRRGFDPDTNEYDWIETHGYVAQWRRKQVERPLAQAEEFTRREARRRQDEVIWMFHDSQIKDHFGLQAYYNQLHDTIQNPVDDDGYAQFPQVAEYYLNGHNHKEGYPGDINRWLTRIKPTTTK